MFMRITNQLTSIYNLYTSGNFHYLPPKLILYSFNYIIWGMKALLFFIILYKYIVTLSLSLKVSNIDSLQFTSYVVNHLPLYDILLFIAPGGDVFFSRRSPIEHKMQC